MAALIFPTDPKDEIMKFLPIFLLFGILSVYGANDADFDGVDDTMDKCPNTPFSDLVDTNGCTTLTLYTQTDYDIIVGVNFSTMNTNTLENTKTSNTTFQADMYHGNLSAQLLTSYFKSEVSTYSSTGWNDTQLSLFYTSKPTEGFIVQTGMGIILPTYSTGYGNEAIDYRGSIALQYTLQPQINLFGGYSYTLINDTEIPKVADYQNTNAFYGGIGYRSPKNNSIHLSYTHSQSIYTGVDPIETLSMGIFIPLNTQWFLLGDYKYGLSSTASDHETALRLGYSF